MLALEPAAASDLSIPVATITTASAGVVQPTCSAPTASICNSFIYFFNSSFDLADGSWYWVTTSATVDQAGLPATGSTDDRAAIQRSSMRPPLRQGRLLPGGYISLVASGDAAPLYTVQLYPARGGDTSIVRLYDDGTDARQALMKLEEQTNINISHLKLMGTQSNKEASVQIIRADGTSYLTLDNVTFDGGEYA
jgi:hypothetical protein